MNKFICLVQKSWLLPLSATRVVIDCWKHDKCRCEKRALLRNWQKSWFWTTVAACIVFALLNVPGVLCEAGHKLLTNIEYLVAIVAFWRCNEIVYAFYKDALDGLAKDGEPSNTSSSGNCSMSKTQSAKGDEKSLFTQRERISFLIKSYFELILYFGLIYFVLSIGIVEKTLNWWFRLKDNAIAFDVPSTSTITLFDAVYFSGVTITTTGYGDISPQAWPLRVLSVYEAIAGLVLLVGAFAVYLGGSNCGSNAQQNGG